MFQKDAPMQSFLMRGLTFWIAFLLSNSQRSVHTWDGDAEPSGVLLTQRSRLNNSIAFASLVL